MARIALRDVTIAFPIFSSHTRSIRTAVFFRLGGSLAAHNDTVIVRALVNISLDLVDGDRLGLVGSNGAGKTTFLRVASGVYPPLAGEAVVDGKVSSFTDIGLGMDPEATGWQNIHLPLRVFGLDVCRGPGACAFDRRVFRTRRVPRPAGANIFHRHVRASCICHLDRSATR